MATIRKRGNSYHVQIRRSGFLPITKSFKNLSTAKQWARKTESDLERNIVIPTQTTLTTHEILNRYESEVIPNLKGEKQERYKARLIRRLIPDVRFCNLLPSDIRKFRDSRLQTVSTSTVVRELAVLRKAFNHAIREWECNIENPVSKVSIPKFNNARDRRLEAGEEEKLLRATGELQRIIILALETGMRRSEILGIKKSHIDFARQTLFIPLTKTDTPRTIPLSSRAISVLREQSGASDNVISIEETTLFSCRPDGITKAFSRLCKRQGLENLRFHDLRHEATSRLFEKGLNPVEVATITGHKDTRMLMRYTHLRAEDLVKRLG